MLNDVKIDIFIDECCHYGYLGVEEGGDILIFLSSDIGGDLILGEIYNYYPESGETKLAFKLTNHFYDEEKDALDIFNIKYDFISDHDAVSELKITSKIEVKISMEANSGE